METVPRTMAITQMSHSLSLLLKIAFTVFLLFAQWIQLTEQRALDDYILDYQEVDYDSFELHANHMRVKRSLDSHLYLRFRAYDRDFYLKLRTATDIYSPDHLTENSDGSLEPVDLSFIYEGSLVDDPHSFAHIAIINGTARGHIHIPGDTIYYIEPAGRFFKHHRFQSVIYPLNHMNLDPYRHLREKAGHCGNKHAQEWMDEVLSSQASHETPKRYKRNKRWSDTLKYSQHKYRARREETIRPKKALCYLYLRTDPTIWEFFKKKKFKDIRNGQDMPDDRVKDEIHAFFASHVASVKFVFNSTLFSTFDNSLAYQGFSFLVQKTKIMSPSSEKCGTRDSTKFCDEMDSSNFLNLNANTNHDDFCLSYVFGHRDFVGVLGLAWVGRLAGEAGLCGRYYNTKKGYKSLNTGIISTILWGSNVPPRISENTFAHEIGHNFGSPHDSGSLCAPYGTDEPTGKDGNYIMYALATPGILENNHMFSPCSKDNITRLLDCILNEKFGRTNCFQDFKSSFCGNNIVEDNEECDCGYNDDCTDICCYPKNDDKECQLVSRFGNKVACSPTQGPCCRQNCTLIPQSSKICHGEDACSFKQYCSGNSSICPPFDVKPNMTLCNSNSQVCLAGECAGSVCNSIGWDECFLTSTDTRDGPTKEELCYVSCLNPETKQCVTSSSEGQINNEKNKNFRDLLINAGSDHQKANGIQLPPGSPCDNYEGYCDVFHLCRGINNDGPLARLKNFLFHPETLENIKTWMKKYWWAVILMFIPTFAAMAMFIYYCSVHTPSSNPNLPTPRRFSLPFSSHGSQTVVAEGQQTRLRDRKLCELARKCCCREPIDPDQNSINTPDRKPIELSPNSSSNPYRVPIELSPKSSKPDREPIELSPNSSSNPYRVPIELSPKSSKPDREPIELGQKSSKPDGEPIELGQKSSKPDGEHTQIQ